MNKIIDIKVASIMTKRIVYLTVLSALLSFFSLELSARVVNAPQGWTQVDRGVYYYTPQGSKIIPYEWFIYLEEADSDLLFRNNQHFLEMGFLTSEPSRLNPYGLPLGFTKENIDKEDWLGLNCSMCHAQDFVIEKEKNNGTGTRDITYRVEGASGFADFYRLFKEMRGAIHATLTNDDKFDRFSEQVLEKNNKGEIKKLTEKMDEALVKLDLFLIAAKGPTEWGPGRIDAFSMAANYIVAHNNPDESVREENLREAIAPVDYPHLWGAPTLSRVEWPGNLANFLTIDTFNDPASLLGPFSRNVLQAVAAFADFEIPKNNNKIAYPNSINVLNLEILESLLRRLKSPRWPSRLLGEIDRAKALKGRRIYRKECLDCHAIKNRITELLPTRVDVTPVVELQTDESTLEVLDGIFLSGGFEGRQVQGIIGAKIGSTSGVMPLASNAVTGILLNTIGVEEARPLLQNFDPFLLDAEYIRGYKSRPLNGIWASSPFLHNGSVPSIYELLLPADQRVKEFYIGSRRLDTEKIGLQTTIDTSSGVEPFLFDTRLKANSNSGHEYGTDLPLSERMELIEFIKTL